jgi:hypothetical protein
VSAVAAARSRAVAIPVWAWLGGIVVLSIAVRVALAHRMVAPWIMEDEIVYSELAKNLAAHGAFLVRGVPSHGYGFVYPAVIAPAWAMFTSIPSAYSAAKAINAVVMSLTAVPAYFLARRVLSQRLSLVAAALAVAVPSMLYTGVIMTENVFYPIFVTACLLLVLTLEKPTAFRQIGLLVLCAIAFETRAQAVALFAAVATAPIVLGLVERRGVRGTVRPFAWLFGLLGAGAVVALLGTVARGRSPETLLGAYRVAASSTTYTPGGILRFFLYHVAGLDLYLGIVPFGALLAVWLLPRRPQPAQRAFAAASLAVTVWLVAEVAAFASASYVNRIEERNMFYLAPFFLIALVGLGVDGLVPRARRAVVPAAVVAGVLPFFIPYTRFITTSAVSDTFALLPWWWAQDHLFHLPTVRWVALAVSLAAAAVFVVVPRRHALVLAGLVAAYFIATAYVVEAGRHGIHQTSVGDLWAGTHEPHPDWIDRTVGSNASVSVLWTGTMPSRFSVYENEFFSRSVRTVYDVDGAAPPDPLPETVANRGPKGVLETAGGQPVRAQYVLAPGTLELAGKLLVADPVGVDLYRVNGPVVILTHVSGLYANDTWSGRHVTYQRVECTGGMLAVQLQGDSNLFPRPQTVVATENGAVVGRATIPVTAEKWLTVPLHPVNGICAVRLTVGRTAVPGPQDRRHLGAHFLNFVYTRP